MLVGVVAALGLMGGWSARALLAPPDPIPNGRAYATISVKDGSVERNLRLDVAAAWSGGQVVNSVRGGVVTERLAKAGRPVTAGDVLYTVDLAPVVILTGRVPAFRALKASDRGADVAQLQRYLTGAGFMNGDVDGVFGSVTAAGVKAWQKSLSTPRTGIVDLGDIVFVSSLPAVWAWDGNFSVGVSTSAGTKVGSLLPASPQFTVVLPENQAGLVEPGMNISIEGPSSTWSALIGEIAPPKDDNSAIATLIPDKNAPTICGDKCGTVPAAGTGSLTGTIVVVPRTSGPMVPTAALVVGNDGTTAVVTEEGSRVPVEVIASSGGRAIIEGLKVGTRLRVPAVATKAS